jgi:hypothetical protein
LLAEPPAAARRFHGSQLETNLMHDGPDSIEPELLDDEAPDHGTLAGSTDGPDDPHGGQERMPRSRPDPDPLSELATIDGSSQDNDPDRPHLALQRGAKPGFGPDELTPSQFEGSPDLGIDPREAASLTGNGR